MIYPNKILYLLLHSCGRAGIHSNKMTTLSDLEVRMRTGIASGVILVMVISSSLFAQKMTVKDSEANVLMEVNDEGDIGSITLPAGSSPTPTTNKLYNVGGSLYWNGTALGTAGSAGVKRCAGSGAARRRLDRHRHQCPAECTHRQRGHRIDHCEQCQTAFA